jgi:precorrin-8X/cobalt-precorrin-8 methylmutase
MIDYLKNGADIYRLSFATIRSEVNLDQLPEDLQAIAVRIIHACGMTDVLQDIQASPHAAAMGRDALAKGAPILCDVQMVAYGIIRELLPCQNLVRCTLNEPDVATLAKDLQTTRSAAAVELWRSHLAGAIVAIGNAPTALFHVLELLEAGAPKPALILGFPVGFVGAAESKQLLATLAHHVPFITLHGRRGGSAIAAAAVNALASDEVL